MATELANSVANSVAFFQNEKISFYPLKMSKSVKPKNKSQDEDDSKEEMQTCKSGTRVTGCGKTKPISEFKSDSKGVRKQCKKCVANRAKFLELEKAKALILEHESKIKSSNTSSEETEDENDSDNKSTNSKRKSISSRSVSPDNNLKSKNNKKKSNKEESNDEDDSDSKSVKSTNSKGKSNSIKSTSSNNNLNHKNKKLSNEQDSDTENIKVSNEPDLIIKGLMTDAVLDDIPKLQTEVSRLDNENKTLRARIVILEKSKTAEHKLLRIILEKLKFSDMGYESELKLIGYETQED